MSTRTAAQSTRSTVRRDRAQARRDAAMAAAAGSQQAGRTAGMQAVTAMREVLATMRAETAGDPVARAVASTWMLHGLVGAGPRSDSDSLAAAGQADRQQAVLAILSDPAVGMDLAAVATLLGLADESSVRNIAAGPRKSSRAA